MEEREELRNKEIGYLNKRLEIAEINYKNGVEDKEWNRNNYSHYFWEAMGNCFYANSDIPEEIMNSPEIREEVMQTLMGKVKELNVRVDKDILLKMIRFCPEAIEHIDILDKYYNKDEFLMEAIEKYPEVLRTTYVKDMIEKDPMLEKRIELSKLESKKKDLDNEMEKLEYNNINKDREEDNKGIE